MKQIKFIQLLPTVVDMGGGVTAAAPGEVPGQWSVYKGEPGEFEWLADFKVWVDAMRYAQAQAVHYGAQVHEGGM